MNVVRKLDEDRVAGVTLTPAAHDHGACGGGNDLGPCRCACAMCARLLADPKSVHAEMALRHAQRETMRDYPACARSMAPRRVTRTPRVLGAELAAARGLVLVTLDTGIPGAEPKRYAVTPQTANRLAARLMLAAAHASSQGAPDRDGLAADLAREQGSAIDVEEPFSDVDVTHQGGEPPGAPSPSSRQ